MWAAGLYNPPYQYGLLAIGLILDPEGLLPIRNDVLQRDFFVNLHQSTARRFDVVGTSGICSILQLGVRGSINLVFDHRNTMLGKGQLRLQCPVYHGHPVIRIPHCHQGQTVWPGAGMGPKWRYQGMCKRASQG